jgi:hypothetical protein
MPASPDPDPGMSPEERDYKIKAYAMQAITKITEAALEAIARQSETEKK